MAKKSTPEPTGEAGHVGHKGVEGPPSFGPGDEVVIRCKVVRVEPHGLLTVVTDPVDVPGSEAYQQTIHLHDVRQAERA